MTKYNNISNASELARAIIKELNRENIMHEAHIPTKGFAVLAEGNDLGEFEITVMSAYEVRRYSNAELADMQGYGWAIINSIEDIHGYAQNYFWVEAVLSGEHSTERV